MGNTCCRALKDDGKKDIKTIMPSFRLPIKSLRKTRSDKKSTKETPKPEKSSDNPSLTSRLTRDGNIESPLILPGNYLPRQLPRKNIPEDENDVLLSNSGDNSFELPLGNEKEPLDEHSLEDNSSVYVTPRGNEDQITTRPTKLKYLRQAKSISGQSSARYNTYSMRRPDQLNEFRHQESESNLELNRASILDEIRSSLVKSSDLNTPVDTFCQISLGDHRALMQSLVAMKTTAHQLRRLLLDDMNDLSPQKPISPRRTLASPFSGSMKKMSIFAENMGRLEELEADELREKVEQLSEIGNNLMREMERKNARIEELEAQLAADVK